MQGWHYGKGLIYYRPIFRLTKLAFLSISLLEIRQEQQVSYIYALRGPLQSNSFFSPQNTIMQK